MVELVHQAQRDAEAAAVEAGLLDRLQRGRGVALGCEMMDRTRWFIPLELDGIH